MAVADDVPSASEKPDAENSFGATLVMLTAGAATVTCGPRALPSQASPLWSTPDTAITPGMLAGVITSGPDSPRFPAAATTTASLDSAYRTASTSSGVAAPAAPRDKLITFAP